MKKCYYINYFVALIIIILFASCSAKETSILIKEPTKATTLEMQSWNKDTMLVSIKDEIMYVFNENGELKAKVECNIITLEDAHVTVGDNTAIIVSLAFLLLIAVFGMTIGLAND